MNIERPNDPLRRPGWLGGCGRGVSPAGLSGMIFGALIVVVGLAILLDNLGIIQVYDMWRFWPLLLIGIGIAKVLEKRGPAAQVWGGLMTVAGVAFLLDNLHVRIFHFDVSDVIWPIAIIAFGLFLLLKAMDRRKLTDVAPVPSDTDTSLGAWAIFSSVKRKVDIQDFKGGEVAALFGEVKVDLRKAGIAGERAVIDVNALFGGVEIRVPENWSVVMKGTGVFGAFEDKSVPPRLDPGVKPPQLIITGTAIFGATKVDN